MAAVSEQGCRCGPAVPRAQPGPQKGTRGQRPAGTAAAPPRRTRAPDLLPGTRARPWRTRLREVSGWEEGRHRPHTPIGSQPPRTSGRAWTPLAKRSGAAAQNQSRPDGGCGAGGCPGSARRAEPRKHGARNGGETLPPAAKLRRTLPAGRSPLPASPPRQGEWVPQCPPCPGSAPEPCCPHRHRLPPAPRSSGVERNAGGGGAGSPGCNAPVGGRPPRSAARLTGRPEGRGRGGPRERVHLEAAEGGAARPAPAGAARTTVMHAAAPRVQLARAGRPPLPSSFASGSPDSSELPPAGPIGGLLSHLHENVAASSA